jgi:signal transduction histidine kinase
MPNTRNKSLVLLSKILITLSVGLFTAGMMKNDLSGPARWLLPTAFILASGTAMALIVVVARAGMTKKAPVSKIKQRSLDISRPIKTDPSAGILSDAAGELKTSVGAIQEELEEIIDDEVPADKEHMQSLYDETDRLKKIIEGMEQLSKAQALANSLKKQSVDLAPLLNGIVEKMRGSDHGKGVAFTVECESGLTMTADQACLSTILENLVDNAAKAVKNSGSVTLAAERHGDQVVFSVRDTGIGIKPKQLPHLYERFFRGMGSGIGMGLAIVKELVDTCGGKIEVKTKPGEGSEFTVQLPTV